MRERVAVLPLSVHEVPVSCAKLSEGAETRQDEWDVAFVVIFRFEPFGAVGDCEEDQKTVVSTCRGGGLTMKEVGHLVRPPGYVSDKERWWLSSRLCLLIARSLIADAYHMVPLMRQLINRFGIILCRFEGECWKYRGPRDKRDTNSERASAGAAREDCASEFFGSLCSA